MRDELDTFGIFVAAVMAVTVAVAALILLGWDRQARADRAAYQQCVADIPGYLDADEILHQEHECKDGVAP